MVPERADAVRGLRAIYIDAGTRDEYYLDLGAEAFRRELASIGVTDVFFELFDAGHGDIEYHYPLAIRYLAEPLGRPHPESDLGEKFGDSLEHSTERQAVWTQAYGPQTGSNDMPSRRRL